MIRKSVIVVFLAFLILVWVYLMRPFGFNLNKRIIGEYRYNQLQACETLKKIRAAQIVFRSKEGKYGSLKDIVNARLVTSEIENEVYFGYKIRLSLMQNSYKVVAIPIGSAKSHSFYLDESGIIRASLQSGKEPDSSDPAIVEQ